MARHSLEMSPIRSAPLSNNDRPGNLAHPVSVPNTPLVAERPPSPEKKALHDSNAFLTALAAQERRVLELKEELQKAEVDLDKLKRQWAIHEAAKKRNEIRQLEPLQPLSAPLVGTSTYSNSDAARTSREEERRKLKPITTRQPQRTVFSGSRHTKTLSLLSPKPLTEDTHVPDNRVAKVRRGTTDGPPRSRTVPNISAHAASSSHTRNITTSRQSMQGQHRDDIVETGKQFVGDLREGLWTFFEDLRQATVGEDIDTSTGSAARKTAMNQKPDEEPKLAISNDHTLKQAFPARGSSLHGNPSMSSKAAAEVGVIRGHNVNSTAMTTKPKHQRHKTVHTVFHESDDWDNWDSPPRQASPHQSSTESLGSDCMASPVSDRSTPRTSMSSNDATPRPKRTLPALDDRKEIPWPALTKLSPGNLKRTASSFMSEWERSLTSADAETKADSALLSGSAPTKEQKAD